MILTWTLLAALGSHLAAAEEPAPASQPVIAPSDPVLAVRMMADQLAAQTKQLPRNPRYLRFAVLPFEEVGGEAKEAQLGTVVADMVATDLLRDHRLALVERARLNAVIGELALQQTGLTDENKAAEVGKMANADVLVIGSIALVGDAYKASAKLVDVQTAQVHGVAQCDLPAADLVALSSQAVVLRSRTDAMFRSLLLPGWGQHYNRQPIKGWLFSGTTAGLLLAGIGFEVSGLALHNLYYQSYKPEDDGFASAGDPQFQQNLEARYDLAQTNSMIGHVLLGGTAAFWAFNAVEAYVSGVDGSEMVGGSAGD